MRISYKPLLRLLIRHDYYKDGNGANDFSIEPTAATRAGFDRLGLVFRKTREGFSLYAEVVPDTREVRKTWGQDVLRFTFLLAPINPLFEQITKLPGDRGNRPVGSVFYFSNLYEDEDWNDGKLYLRDSSIDPDTRFGRKAIPLVNSGASSFLLDSAAATAALGLSFTDIYGHAFEVPEPEDSPRPYSVSTSPAGLCELRIELGKVPGLTGGRYTLNCHNKADHSHNSSIDLYYEPDPIRKKTFAIIELFSAPATCFINGRNPVPEAYRFVETAHTIPDPEKEYNVRFRSLETLWHFKVFKKYQPDEAYLAVDIQDATGASAGFMLQETSPGQVVFQSPEEIALSEQLNSFTLVVRRDGNDVKKKLPNPDIGIPLKKSNTGQWVSEVNVYV